MNTTRELVIKVVAMPSDLNPHGDMFGGWIISQMDLAAYLHARKLTRARIVTVAVDKLVFHKPVYSGDAVMCYTTTTRMGRTSITVHVEVMVERLETNKVELVTEGDFVFVAIGQDRQPVPLLGETAPKDPA
jgi:acyl-CoA thioesterase YciA